jgi:AcrR family transcriptional regulator
MFVYLSRKIDPLTKPLADAFLSRCTFSTGTLESLAALVNSEGFSNEARSSQTVKKSASASRAPRRARARALAVEALNGPSADAATSDRILISAAHLFATHGFAHTSMPTIAKQSGITPGAIYRHFESKAQLLVEVVRYALKNLPTSIRVLEPARLDASDLSEFTASYTTPEYKLIRQLSLEIHAAGARDRNAMALLSKVNEEAASVISCSIRDAQKDGTVDTALDPRFAAIFLQATIMGLAHLDTLRPDLIGNHAWHDFILDRVSALLGFHRPAEPKPETDPSPVACAEFDPD